MASTASTQLPNSLNATNSTTSRWWEKKLQKIYETSDSFDEIRSISDPFLFQDGTLCNILASRRRDWLDAFLSYLGSNVKCRDNLNVAKEIVRLLRQEPQSLPSRDWSWVLHNIASVPATAIAETINEQILLDLSQIPFYSLVRHILGYEAPIVIVFLEGLSFSANNLARQVRQVRELDHKWISLEKEMEYRHPLARWLVASEILHTSDALRFLSEPVKQFFTTPDHDLTQRFKQLAYLAQRYKITINTLDVDWSMPFSMDCSFMEAISNPKCLAESDRKDVAEAFRNLSAADFLDHPSKRMLSLSRRWITLSDNVTTLVALDRESVPSVMKLAEVFIQQRNYESATAIGRGLQLFHPSLTESWPIWKFINPENNFATCRALSKIFPGLQWMGHAFEDLRKSKNAPEQLYKVFQFVQYLGPEEPVKDPKERVPEKETVGKEILAGDARSINDSPPGSKRKATWEDELDRKRTNTIDNTSCQIDKLPSITTKKLPYTTITEISHRYAKFLNSLHPTGRREEDSMHQLPGLISLANSSRRGSGNGGEKKQKKQQEQLPVEKTDSLRSTNPDPFSPQDEDRRPPNRSNAEVPSTQQSFTGSEVTEVAPDTEVIEMMKRNFPATNGSKAAESVCLQDQDHSVEGEEEASNP